MLDKILSFIADFLKTDSSWTTVTSTEGTVKYRIEKGFVHVDGTGLSPTTQWKTIATLPSGVRPNGDNYRGQGYCSSYGRVPMTILIDTNGKVHISTTTASSGGGFTAIYPKL